MKFLCLALGASLLLSGLCVVALQKSLFTIWFERLYNETQNLVHASLISLTQVYNSTFVSRTMWFLCKVWEESRVRSIFTRSPHGHLGYIIQETKTTLQALWEWIQSRLESLLMQISSGAKSLPSPGQINH
jgi:hypothetical protein